MSRRQDKKTLKDSDSSPQNDLAETFDEKMSLSADQQDHHHHDYVDSPVDEKAALHQAHQDELDELLSDTPPTSRSPSSGQNHDQGDNENRGTTDTAEETSKAKPNETELEHIFEECDKNENVKDAPKGAATTNVDSSSDKRQSSASGTSTEVGRPSLADIKKTADETKGREKQDIPFDFNKFLEQMRRKSARPIVLYFKSFLSTFDRRPWAVNDQIRIIHRFMEFIFVKMRECEVWRDVSEHEFENAKEGMEKLVMNRLYNVTFSPNTTDDKERDEILHQKISIFRWIREEHLDIPVTPGNESFLKFAQTELLKINNYKAPRDKLICILNCCKIIFGLIKHTEGEDGGADKFLPILIYVIIRANPPRLVSNVQYISRFRNPEHLQSESGYYLTNLLGSISFIESMDASSLSITKEEFDANIERTVNELEQERPSVAQDKQKINYDNVVHPSRSPRGQAQPLIDPAKAAALIERGSSFAQKTMQKPLNFVGKIFQGLNEGSPSSSSQEDGVYVERHDQSQDVRASSEPRSQHQLYNTEPDTNQGYTPQPYAQVAGNGATYPAAPNLPQRPLPIDPRIVEAHRQFDANLKTIIAMFPNVEPDVCFMILQANEGHMSRTVDSLLEISDPDETNRVAEYENLSRAAPQQEQGNNQQQPQPQSQEQPQQPQQHTPPVQHQSSTNSPENTSNNADEEELIKL